MAANIKKSDTVASAIATTEPIISTESIQFNTLSDKDLRTLLKKVRSELESRTYFEFNYEDVPCVESSDQESDMYYSLPSNAKELVESGKIIMISYKEDENAWMCYEEGHAWKATLKIQGLKRLVYVHKIQHQSKHTFTETRRITIGKETYVYSNGDYAVEECHNYKVLSTLHNALNIPGEQTAQMIHFLFLKDSWFPYIEEHIPSLTDEWLDLDIPSEMSDASESEEEFSSDYDNHGAYTVGDKDDCDGAGLE